MAKKIINVGVRPAVIRLVKKTGASVSFSQGVVPQNAVNNATELSFKLLNKPEIESRFVLGTFDTPDIINPNTYVTNSNVYSIDNDEQLVVDAAIATNDPNYTTRNIGLFMKFKPNELQYLLGDRPGEQNPRQFSVMRYATGSLNASNMTYTAGSIIATRGVYFNDLNYYVPLYIGTLKRLEETWGVEDVFLGMTPWYSTGTGRIGKLIDVSHQIPVTSVAITNTDTSVMVLDEIVIEHTVTPSNADIATTTYSTSNPDIAIFPDPTLPNLEIVGPGNFTVTVAVTDILGTTVQTTKSFISDVNTLPLTMTFTVNAGEQISLTPVTNDEDILVKLDWGDNISTGYNAPNDQPITHTFTNAGTYQVKLYSTFELSKLTVGKATTSPGLRAVTSWGEVPVQEFSFRNCVNLTSVPTTLDAGTLSLAEMFYGCTSFNQDISMWDVSGISHFNGMFFGASSFNKSLSAWVTSAAERMDNMFAGAVTFNQNIGGWDVSHVTNFSGMFDGALAFNQDITQWDVSDVLDMSFMFRNAPTFNRPIGIWDVSQVQTMESMFQGISYPSTFNQDISMWDVGNVTNMNRMFKGNNAFNQNLRYWCVSNIGSRPLEFTGASTPIGTINEPRWGLCPIRDVVVTINGLDTPIRLNDVRHLTYTLDPDTPVQSTVWSTTNEDVATIDPETGDVIFVGLGNVSVSVSVNGLYTSTRAVTVVDVLQPMTLMTTGTDGGSVLINLVTADERVQIDWGDGSPVVVSDDGLNSHTYTGTSKRLIRLVPLDTDYMPPIQLNGDIEEVVSWFPGDMTTVRFHTAGVTTCKLQRVPSTKPATTDLSQMFVDCTLFNDDINGWDVSQVTDMSNMFSGCTSFNQPLDNWDVSSVTNMQAMFNGATVFNRNLAWWCVSDVVDHTDFNTGGILDEEYYPTWGTCPSRVYTLTIDPVDELDIGDESVLSLTLTPAITIVHESWTTEDPLVATVDSITRTVTGIGVGTTKLHVTINHVFVGEVTVTVVQGTVVNSPDDFEMHRVMSPINLAGTVSES